MEKVVEVLSEYLQRDRKLGLILIIIGVIFTLIGIFTLFDKGFLALGNLAAAIGFAFFIGPKDFLLKIKNGPKQIVIGYVVGLILILLGYVYIGLFCELGGVFLLIKPIFNTVKHFILVLLSSLGIKINE